VKLRFQDARLINPKPLSGSYKGHVIDTLGKPLEQGPGGRIQGRLRVDGADMDLGTVMITPLKATGYHYLGIYQ